MQIRNTFIPPIGIQKLNTEDNRTTTNTNFADHLQAAIKNDTNLTISKHAKTRLEQRNIEISSEDWKKISEKVTEAKQMGVNESLVLLDHAALIVSAKNQTVITAMDRSETNSKIFTNINGTIII
ncbi:MAG: TIGR02530 family flagellar biosynthesis protein [Caldibacillus thermoamylovorans]|nr:MULTISPECIES: TIGR02530 family flagellar biosynthesis protein [Bacillaceae]MCB5934036.1 flagellar protein [Bacillus sp. DFI.2.34]MCB7075264.1 flagellar protein [Caldibacillus thermoamylovorans]MCM3053520.1 flagellar protein [Caldibacillus thermoamylovorans]MCM3797688.1 flagellar protein [Caldibacillus thermoamylovorans]MED4851305.1 TIGR02530 family flagellar biosynthesis protein [Caldifermentibacillus hisashii]